MPLQFFFAWLNNMNTIILNYIGSRKSPLKYVARGCQVFSCTSWMLLRPTPRELATAQQFSKVMHSGGCLEVHRNTPSIVQPRSDCRTYKCTNDSLKYVGNQKFIQMQILHHHDLFCKDEITCAHQSARAFDVLQRLCSFCGSSRPYLQMLLHGTETYIDYGTRNSELPDHCI